MAKQTEIAAHLDLTSRSIRELITRGVFGKQATLDECRVAYIRHLRERAAGREAETGDLDLVEERARLAKEQADQTALKNAQTRGEFVPLSDHEELLFTLCSGLAMKMRGLPSRAAPEVRVAASDAEGEAILRKLVDEALADVADVGARIEARLDAARERHADGSDGASAPEAPEDGDSQPVG